MDPAEPSDGSLRVWVVFSPAPRAIEGRSLCLPAGSTVGDALAASGLGGPRAGELACGVWGRRCAPDQRLRDGDRVELYRALTVDPKEARRQRYRAQPRVRGKKY